MARARSIRHLAASDLRPGACRSSPTRGRSRASQPTSRPARSWHRRRSDTDPVHRPLLASARLRCAPEARSLARPGRQSECRDGGREAASTAPACVKVLRAGRTHAWLAMSSPPLDTGAAWQGGRLFLLFADEAASQLVLTLRREPASARAVSRLPPVRRRAARAPRTMGSGTRARAVSRPRGASRNLG